MKYLIDIDHAPYLYMDENNNMSPPLYKAKGFNSLVFDQNGLDKLEKYDGFDALQIELDARYKGYDSGYDNGHRDGLKDAWELVQKVASMTYNELSDADIPQDWRLLSYQEVKEKFDEYEKSKFKIGDGIENNMKHDKAIIVGLEDNGRLYTCFGMRGVFSLSKVELEFWDKTGITYPEASKLFELIKDGISEDDYPF